MTASISQDPTWVPILTKPTDGDKRAAQILNISFEGLAWRTDHLYANCLRNTNSAPTNSGTFVFAGGIFLAGATSLQIISPNSRTYSRVVTDLPSRNPSSWWAEAEEELTTPRPAYKQRYSPLAPEAPWLVWRWRVPTDSTLKSVKVQLSPAVGAHGGNVPNTQPKMSLWKQTTSNSGLMTSIGTAQLNAATAAAYEQPQDLSLALNYSSWGADDLLVIAVRGEEGTNASAASLYSQGALRVFHPRVEFARGKIGEE